MMMAQILTSTAKVFMRLSPRKLNVRDSLKNKKEGSQLALPMVFVQQSWPFVFRRLIEQAMATGPITKIEVTFGYNWSRN